MKKSLSLFYPRKYNPFLTLKEIPTVKLEGNLKKDGLTKYDLDFIETVEFTQKSLNFLVNCGSLPVKTIEPREQYLCFSVKEEYKYDYTRPESNSVVSLIVDLKKIPLQEKELSVLKSVCASKISENQVLKISVDDLNDAPCSANIQETAQFLAKQFINLIDKCREISQNHAVPLVEKKSKEFPFPKGWLVNHDTL
jgi:hypothetical protein